VALEVVVLKGAPVPQQMLSASTADDVAHWAQMVALHPIRRSNSNGIGRFIVGSIISCGLVGRWLVSSITNLMCSVARQGS
jgi:hypothetical protein